MLQNLPSSVREIVKDVSDNDALTFHMADEPGTSDQTLNMSNWDSTDLPYQVRHDGQFIFPHNGFCVGDHPEGRSGMYTRGFETKRLAYGKEFKVPAIKHDDTHKQTAERLEIFSSLKPSHFKRNPNFFVFRHFVDLVPQPLIRETESGFQREYSSRYRLNNPVLEYAVRGTSERDALEEFFASNKLGHRAVWLALTEKYTMPGMQEFAPTTTAWDYLDQNS